MMRSLFTAATGMEAQQLKMDVISNNLANASTVGFKRVRLEFEDLLADQLHAAAPAESEGGGDPSPLEVGLGVRTASTTRSFAQGDMLGTQNPLDVAIQGSGFFRVQRPNGDLAYTRAGNFRVDSVGRLSTAHGELIDPPIGIPTDATAITIQQDGTVLASLPGQQAPQALGALTLTVFQNPSGLQSAGDNLLLPSAASGAAQELTPGQGSAGNLAQGFLESANVTAVQEMIDMISTQRAYELNSKVIQTADQMLQRLTNLR